MRVIELDASRWVSLDDLYDDLLPALGAPDWYGRNYAVVVDSIGVGSINAVEPPYLIRIVGAKHMTPSVLEFLHDARADIAERIEDGIADGHDARDVHIVLDNDS